MILPLEKDALTQGRSLRFWINKEVTGLGLNLGFGLRIGVLVNPEKDSPILVPGLHADIGT
jgi:hypothetical protein